MLKCSKEAFAACPTRHLCGCPEEAVFTEGSECDEFNRQIGSHTMTHADQIRAMSDEELAHWINLNGDKDFSYEHCCTAEWRKKPCNNKCVACLVAWLRQPAEVSGDA